MESNACEHNHRLQKIRQTFVSKQSVIKTSTVLLAVLLNSINVAAILVLACFIVHANFHLLPEEAPVKFIEADREDLKQITPNIFELTVKEEGLYAIESSAVFECEAEEYIHHVLTSTGKFHDVTNKFTRKLKYDEVCHLSDVVLFVSVHPSDPIQVVVNGSSLFHVTVFKIAGYGVGQ